MTRGLRRSSLQVQLDRIDRLNKLEKERARLKKIADDTSKPVHLAAILAVAKIVAMIATIVRAIKRGSRRRK